ncbi:hypothetical protein STEG23_014789, partial [Scotinomys teguina]
MLQEEDTELEVKAGIMTTEKEQDWFGLYDIAHYGKRRIGNSVSPVGLEAEQEEKPLQVSASLYLLLDNFLRRKKEMPQICSFLQNYLETGLDTKDEQQETAQVGVAVSRLCPEVVGNDCSGPLWVGLSLAAIGSCSLPSYVLLR